MDTFQTRSSSRKNVVTLAITFLCLFGLSFFALKVTVALWIFTVVLLAFVMALCLFITGRAYWEMEFRGEELVIFNAGNKQSYFFEDMTRSHFIITQSEKQKQKDTCDMRIKDVPFRMDDVAKYAELQQYIQKHFH